MPNRPLTRSAVLLAALAVAAPALSAPTLSAPQRLTVDRLFSGPDLAGASLRGARFSPDGKLVTYLQGKPDDKDRLDLWAHDIATGRNALLVDSRDKVNALHKKALALGGKDEGAVGPRGDGFYAGYFRDLDGNKLNVFCSGK